MANCDANHWANLKLFEPKVLNICKDRLWHSVKRTFFERSQNQLVIFSANHLDVSWFDDVHFFANFSLKWNVSDGNWAGYHWRAMASPSYRRDRWAGTGRVSASAPNCEWVLDRIPETVALYSTFRCARPAQCPSAASVVAIPVPNRRLKYIHNFILFN